MPETATIELEVREGEALIEHKDALLKVLVYLWRHPEELGLVMTLCEIDEGLNAGGLELLDPANTTAKWEAAKAVQASGHLAFCGTCFVPVISYTDRVADQPQEHRCGGLRSLDEFEAAGKPADAKADGRTRVRTASGEGSPVKASPKPQPRGLQL